MDQEECRGESPAGLLGMLKLPITDTRAATSGTLSLLLSSEAIDEYRRYITGINISRKVRFLDQPLGDSNGDAGHTLFLSSEHSTSRRRFRDHA